MISGHEQYFVGMPEDAGGPNPEIVGKKPFVFAEVDSELLAGYETKMIGDRTKIFARFLSDYVKLAGTIDKDEQQPRILEQIGEVQKDQSILSSRQRYVNSANRLNGLVAILSDPTLGLEGVDDDITDPDVPTFVLNNGDVKFLRIDIKRLQDRLADVTAPKNPNDFAVLGQKRMILDFYEKAKQHFFPDIAPLGDDPEIMM